jgi:hypothetical protein
MAKTVQKQLFISSMVPRLLGKKHFADWQLDDTAMTVSFGRQVSLLKLAKCRSTKRFLTKRHGTCKMKIKKQKNVSGKRERNKKSWKPKLQIWKKFVFNRNHMELNL